MLRVVIDTNVIVSGILSHKGAPAAVRERPGAGRLALLPLGTDGNDRQADPGFPRHDWQFLEVAPFQMVLCMVGEHRDRP
jgi:hypothetical protein